MSLINDFDYLIHKLRISQINNENRSLAKLISFDESILKNNDYISTDTTTKDILHYSSSPDIIPSLPFSPKPLIGKRVIRKEEASLKETEKLIFNNGIELDTINSLISEGDDDDDDIDLDYDDVRQETKPNLPSKPKFLNKPNDILNNGLAQTSFKPPNLNRKFSAANLVVNNAAILPPGIIQPKSRMRSLSSSSLAATETKDIPTTSASPLKFNTPIKSTNNKSKPASLLSKMLKSKDDVMDNPFLLEYGGFTGKGEMNPIELNIYLPNSNEPLKPLKLSVKRTATVEQVIGFSLYNYFDMKIEPLLEEHHYFISNWTMRIAEDDGTIDDDFPALERTRQIEKFAFDCFALCQASPAQVKIHEHSQTISNKPKPSPIIEVNKGANEAISNENNNQLIKIQLFNQKGALHTTTLNISSDTTLSAVQAIVCRKWNLDPHDYELASRQAKHPLEQQATLESLLGITELSLIRRNRLNSNENNNLPLDMVLSNLSQDTFNRRYLVLRRMPMFVNKQERILVIEGYYFHLLASENSVGNFKIEMQAKNAVYHLDSLVQCRILNKVRRRFKVTFSRSHDHKIYDLEAASPEIAEEIVAKLKFLHSSWKNEND